MSSTSTPAPTGPTLEERNYVHLPRPFKSQATAAAPSNRPANRRIRNLKQILAAERDFALGITDSIPSSGTGTGASTSNTAAATAARKAGRGGRKALAGAALRRREEALSAAASTNASGTATPAEMETGEGSEMEGDTTMHSLAETVGDASTVQPVDPEAEERLRKRRALPTYASIEAPPSLRPRKRFCDITGLIAPYTDPKTNLRYHSVEIYEIIKTFGPGVDQQYLSLRGEHSQIK